MADMVFTLDPEHIYVNMSAAAASTTTYLSPVPQASFQQNRFAPVITDMSKYKLAVVSCALNGCRNFPVFIPEIDTTQDDPSVTCYKVTVNFTATPSAGISTFPVTPQAFAFNVCLFDPVIGQGPWYACMAAASSSGADLANHITNALNTTGTYLFNTYIAGMICNYDPSTGRISISLPASVVADQRFAISVGIPAKPPFTPAPSPANSSYAALAMGMPYAPPGSPASEFTLYSQSDGTGPPAGQIIRFPNEPYYTVPTVSLSTAAATSNTYSATASLIWQSQSGLPLPQITNGRQGEVGAAYWMYDYEWFVKIMNDALLRAFNQAALAAQVDGFSVTVQAPFVQYNASTKNFTLYSDAGATPSNRNFPASVPVGPQVTLSYVLNPMLEDLLLFPASFAQVTGNATLDFSEAPVYTNPTGAPDTASDLFVGLTPSNPCVATLWSPVTSLVFLSKLMPVRTEVISAPIRYGGTDAGSGGSVATAYDTAQILTDVTPVVADGADWRTETTTFTPTVLRWVDMPAGAMALSNLDFSLAWKNGRTGTVTPIYLNSGANFTVKILFQRRDVL